MSAGKVFHTSLLRGEYVEVILKNGNIATGIMVEFFERNNSIVLVDVTYYKETEEEKLEKINESDLAIIKGDGWVEINVPKVVKKELRKLVEEMVR